MLASIIIPCHGRQELLERAINSVLACNGSGEVEIIVVDDCSPVALRPANLRPQDRLIRNERNVGAAVSRNTGIRNAKGQLIYFLDSDDYFISRDFRGDLERTRPDSLYYCALKSQGYLSSFPAEISKADYFQLVFHKYPYLGQTSSLMFHRSLGLLFDESLPTHEDWDLVYCQALMRGIPVKRIDGLVYFDRSDKKSLSRSGEKNRSLVWLKKLNDEAQLNQDTIRYVRYNILGGSSKEMSWYAFIVMSIRYFLHGQIRPIRFAKLVFRRLEDLA